MLGAAKNSEYEVNMSDEELLDEALQAVVPFGKYQGKKLGEILQEDRGPSYLGWLVEQDWLKEPLKGYIQLVLDEES